MRWTRRSRIVSCCSICVVAMTDLPPDAPTPGYAINLHFRLSKPFSGGLTTPHVVAADRDGHAALFRHGGFDPVAAPARWRLRRRAPPPAQGAAGGLAGA